MRISGRFCKSWWCLLSVSGVALLVSALFVAELGLRFADVLLVVRDAPQNADVIVVLGGECRDRSDKVVQLYRQGYAARILIAGKNEDTLIAQRLRSAGIPDDAVRIEPVSKNTFENAEFSVPVLEQWQARKVLLVTSWFHSRRALAVFCNADTSVRFRSVPTSQEPLSAIRNNDWLRKRILMEYLKITGYWVRYGVMPVQCSE